jgi:hypothetical protein
MGFLQGLYALDAADGQVTSSSDVVHLMVQSLLQCVMSKDSDADESLGSIVC